MYDCVEFFDLNYDNNCIIQFETDYDHDHIFLKEIHTSLFINCDNSIIRQSEYLTCLNKNLDNPEINKIYYFKKEKIQDASIIKKDLNHKLKHIEYTSNKLSYKFIFDYIKNIFKSPSVSK